jgi:hypothetical protein
MKSLSFRTRRAIVLLLVVGALVLTANSLLGLRWFGDYDTEVAILSFAFVYIVDHLIGITHDEILARRSSQLSRKGNRWT